MVCSVFQKFKTENTLLIKCHPRTENKIVEKILELFPREKIITSYNLKSMTDNEILNISDKVLGMTSIMLAHALVLDKPTLSIQINPTETGKKRSNYLLNKVLSGTEEEIFSFLKSKVIRKNLIDTCIFTESCSKIYREME